MNLIIIIFDRHTHMSHTYILPLQFEKRKAKEERDIQSAEKQRDELEILRQSFVSSSTHDLVPSVPTAAAGAEATSSSSSEAASGGATADISADAVVVDETPTNPAPAPTSSSTAPPTATADQHSRLLPVNTAITKEIVEAQLDNVQTIISQCKARLARTKEEEPYMRIQNQIEVNKRQQASEWMLAMQGVVWPTNPEDRDIGQPITPTCSAAVTAASSAPHSTDSDKYKVSYATIHIYTFYWVIYLSTCIIFTIIYIITYVHTYCYYYYTYYYTLHIYR